MEDPCQQFQKQQELSVFCLAFMRLQLTQSLYLPSLTVFPATPVITQCVHGFMSRCHDALDGSFHRVSNLGFCSPWLIFLQPLLGGPLGNRKNQLCNPHHWHHFLKNQSAACQVDYSGPLPTSTDQHFAIITIDKALQIHTPCLQHIPHSTVLQCTGQFIHAGLKKFSIC